MLFRDFFAIKRRSSRELLRKATPVVDVPEFQKSTNEMNTVSTIG